MLPDELNYVKHEIEKARAELKKANLVYGDAVASSGGDWAFDDAGSQITAQEANQREKYLQHLLGLVTISGQKEVVIDYQETTNKHITYGSSVVVKMNGTELLFFIGTQKIPGLDNMGNIDIISANSPMGSALIGKIEGEVATWTLPNGKILSAII